MPKSEGLNLNEAIQSILKIDDFRKFAEAMSSYCDGVEKFDLESYVEKEVEKRVNVRLQSEIERLRSELGMVINMQARATDLYPQAEEVMAEENEETHESSEVIMDSSLGEESEEVQAAPSLDSTNGDLVDFINTSDVFAPDYEEASEKLSSTVSSDLINEPKSDLIRPNNNDIENIYKVDKSLDDKTVNASSDLSDLFSDVANDSAVVWDNSSMATAPNDMELFSSSLSK